MRFRCPCPPFRQIMGILTGSRIWDAHETLAKMCLWAFEAWIGGIGSWAEIDLGAVEFVIMR